MPIRKRGFTFIELMVVVGIITLLVTIILVNISQSRQKARINSAKTSLKTALPAIMECKNNYGHVSTPTAGEDICTTMVGLTGAKWPKLPKGYIYGIVSGTAFKVSGDSITLSCDYLTQLCE